MLDLHFETVQVTGFGVVGGRQIPDDGRVTQLGPDRRGRGDAQVLVDPSEHVRVRGRDAFGLELLAGELGLGADVGVEDGVSLEAAGLNEAAQQSLWLLCGVAGALLGHGRDDPNLPHVAHGGAR